MKYTKILFTALFAWSCWACSEDDLTPGEPYYNFAPDADAMDEESVLRREFFNQNGFYILFNDTLRSEYIGTNIEGEPVYKTETVDPAWQLLGYSSGWEYRFSYCQTMERKRQRAEFIAGLVRIMEEHNLTRPYSVLVVDTIRSLYNDYGDMIIMEHEFLNSLRCFAIALPEIKGTDEEKYLLVAYMAGSGLSTKYEGDLQEFYDLTVNRYGNSLYGYDHYGDATLQTHYENGFLRIVSSRLYPSKGEDVGAYLHLLMTKNDEEIRSEFAGYPKIIAKYELIREVAKKAGIKF